MVFIQHIYCPICEKETLSHNGQCEPCRIRAYRQKVAQWNALTVKEKLQDLRKRIEDLERGPARY